MLFQRVFSVKVGAVLASAINISVSRDSDPRTSEAVYDSFANTNGNGVDTMPQVYKDEMMMQESRTGSIILI